MTLIETHVTSSKRQKTTNSTMGANQNYYDILGVDKKATNEGKKNINTVVGVDKKATAEMMCTFFLQSPYTYN